MAIPAYYSLIQRGSTGPDVALVQTWLNGLRDTCTWYHELTTDGRFGTKSVNAVKEFQLKNDMNVDGKVGANTWNVLYTKYTAKHGLHVPYPGIVLRQGSSGGTVRLVQQKLNPLGEKLLRRQLPRRGSHWRDGFGRTGWAKFLETIKWSAPLFRSTASTQTLFVRAQYRCCWP